jgi:hypothetical protein
MREYAKIQLQLSEPAQEAEEERLAYISTVKVRELLKVLS